MIFLTDAMINLIGFGLKVSGVLILSYPVLLLSGFAVQRYINGKNDDMVQAEAVVS